jgi:hypothetical protein
VPQNQTQFLHQVFLLTYLVQMSYLWLAGWFYRENGYEARKYHYTAHDSFTPARSKLTKILSFMSDAEYLRFLG